MASLRLLEATVRSLMGRPSSPTSPSSSSPLFWVYDRAPSEGGSATPRAVRNQRQALPPVPGLLTDAEIVRALRRFRYDPEFRGLKRVSHQDTRRFGRCIPHDDLRGDATRSADAPQKDDLRTHARQAVASDCRDLGWQAPFPPDETRLGNRGKHAPTSALAQRPPGQSRR